MQARQPDDNQLSRLQATLQEEIRQHQLTGEKLVEKKACLLANRPQELARLDQELMLLARKTAQLEVQRMQQLQGMGYPQATLRQFIETLDPRRARPFVDARQRLIRAVDEVARLNQHNRELIDLSLKWIQESVEVIASILTPEAASYSANGLKPKSKGKTITDHTPVQSTVAHDA